MPVSPDSDSEVDSLIAMQTTTVSECALPYSVYSGLHSGNISSNDSRDEASTSKAFTLPLRTEVSSSTNDPIRFPGAAKLTDDEARKRVLSVLHATSRWLAAWREGKPRKLASGTIEIDLFRQARAAKMAQQAAEYRALLESHTRGEIALAKVINFSDTDFFILGGLKAVQREQEQWIPYIHKTLKTSAEAKLPPWMALRLYNDAFIVEQKICGRRPSGQTDVVVKSMLSLLNHDLAFHDIVEKLLSANCDEDWNPRDTESATAL